MCPAVFSNIVNQNWIFYMLLVSTLPLHVSSSISNVFELLGRYILTVCLMGQWVF